MTFSFNALLLAEQSTGMRTLMLGLLEGLRRLRSEDTWVVYMRPGIRDSLKLPAWPECHYVELPAARHLPGRVVIELVGLPGYDRRFGVDASYSGSFYLPLNQRLPCATTFVDFCWRRVPEGYSWGQHLSFNARFRQSLLRADGIVAISETMRRDLVAAFPGLRGRQIAAIPLGVDEAFLQLGEATTKRRSRIDTAPGLTILSSGGTNARKDLRTLALACVELPPDLLERIEVIVIGPAQEHERQRVLDGVPANVRERFSFVGFVPFAEKLRLFSAADLFVFPTLDEGFGLPVLEAMAARVPVLCSDLDVLHEVGGDTVAYAPAGDATAFAQGIWNALAEPDRAAGRADLAFRRAHLFRWRTSAEKLTCLLRHLVQEPQDQDQDASCAG